jgi:hypothetical protein
MIRAVISAYSRAASRAPVLVQSLTSGAVASAGDLTMQAYEGRRLGSFDLARTARMGMFRLVLFGPGYSLWLRQLDKLVQMPSHRSTIAVKVALDQFVWAPPALFTFYVWMNGTEGNSFSQGIARAESSLFPTLCLNWPFWCTIQTITFGIVPPHLRVAFVSFVQVFWSAVLSGINESARLSEQKANVDAAE